MAKLIYGPDRCNTVTFDDGDLRTLSEVVRTRYLSGEGFFVRIGKESVWLHPSIPTRFEFDSDKATELDEDAFTQALTDSYTPEGVSFQAPRTKVMFL